jgi:hypothetical protein
MQRSGATMTIMFNERRPNIETESGQDVRCAYEADLERFVRG